MSMTLEEWSALPELSKKLREILADPVLVAALYIIEKSTAAKAYGPTQLTALGDRCTSLFGYDAGRASVLQDLSDMSIERPSIETFDATYTEEPPPSKNPNLQ